MQTSSEFIQHSRSDSESDFINLPTELILEILSHLDNASLLQLGRTCRRTNHIALSTFFTRNCIQVGEPYLNELVAYTMTPPETLQAVRAALWVQTLHRIIYYIQPGVDRLEADVLDLCDLVRSMRTVRTVKLSFSDVDQWLSFNHGRDFRPEKRLDGERFGWIMRRLLNSIVDGKGCRELRVVGGDSVSELYEDEKDVQRPPKNLMRNPGRLIQLRPKSTIKRFHIHSNMLLKDMFFPWTVNTLSRASTSINVLSFCCKNTPRATWRALLYCLSFPNLTNFNMMFSGTATNAGVAFEDLHSFLARHPSIQHLCLQHAEHPFSVRVLEHSILPQLTTVVAHPSWICSLLDTRESHPDSDTFPHLQSIGLLPSDLTHNLIEEYDLFDKALERVVRLSASRQDEDVILTLQFVEGDDHVEWVRRHASVSRGSKQSVLSSLSSISTLILSGISTSPELLSNLPAFLDLFPRLRMVEFNVMTSHIRAVKDPGFVARLATECFGIRTVKFDIFDVIDLETVRASLIQGRDEKASEGIEEI